MAKSLAFGLMACALASLAGCASQASLREAHPVVDEATKQAPDRVAGCIGDKLEALSSVSHTSISTDPTEAGGFRISGHQLLNGLNITPDTILLVDIAPEAGSSRVQLYTYFLTRDNWVPQVVRSCL
jgi:hypothetical protein